ncbi:hypothetical protein V6N13_083869 [Hibiscus sabdariffa]
MEAAFEDMEDKNVNFEEFRLDESYYSGSSIEAIMKDKKLNLRNEYSGWTEAAFEDMEAKNVKFKGFRLIVETDCKLVVDWISLSVDAPPSFFNLVFELSDMVIKRGFVTRLTSRRCNMEADHLAKAGIE